MCHIKFEVSGLSHISKDKAGVVLSKHSSAWETFFLPLIFHDATVIAKRELLWIPFFGWGLALSDPITINRSKTASAMQQVIQKGKKALESGRWILIFPEGTRIPYGKAGVYRLGGARLAVQAEYPVIPVAHNAGKFWPKRGFIKYPGTIKMVIGEVIETKGKKPEEVMHEAKEWIESTIAKMDHGVKYHA